MLRWFYIVLILVSCESKFEEKSPDAVELGENQLSNRLSNKGTVDEAIDRAISYAQRVDAILDVLGKAYESSAGESPYTPMDFLIEASNGFKDRIPEPKESEEIAALKVERRISEMRLPIRSSNHSCRSMKVMLTTTLDSRKGDESSEASERPRFILTYSLRPCGGEDDGFLSMISVYLYGSSAELKFHQENLQMLFGSLQRQVEVDSEGLCKIETEEETMAFERLVCSSLRVQLSSKRDLLIDHFLLQIKEGSVPLLELEGDLYSGDRVEGHVDAKSQNGLQDVFLRFRDASQLLKTESKSSNDQG